MNVLIVRHGKAGDPEQFAIETGEQDGARPLTSVGKEQIDRVSTHLNEVIEQPSGIYTSPLKRCLQSALILGKNLGCDQIIQFDSLLPNRDPDTFISWLAQQNWKQDELIVVVGHEPYLSKLVSLLLTGNIHTSIQIKKGASCMIRMLRLKKSGPRGQLLFLAPAKLLKQL